VEFSDRTHAAKITKTSKLASGFTVSATRTRYWDLTINAWDGRSWKIVSEDGENLGTVTREFDRLAKIESWDQTGNARVTLNMDMVWLDIDLSYE